MRLKIWCTYIQDENINLAFVHINYKNFLSQKELELLICIFKISLFENQVLKTDWNNITDPKISLHNVF